MAGNSTFMRSCPGGWTCKSQLSASNAHVQSKQDQNTSDTKSKWLAATLTQFLQPLLGWYMSATSVYAQDVHAVECMRETERESQVRPKRPGRTERKPCPLTLSVSFKHFIGCVKHLSLWGLWNCGRKGEGTGELTGQFSRSQQFTSHLNGESYPSPCLSWFDLHQGGSGFPPMS